MSFQFLEITRNGPIATITLNRPDKLNALSIALMEEIYEAADQFQRDTETRVIIFTGAGRYFSAGADLADPQRRAVSEESLLNRQRQTTLGQRVIKKLLDIDQITIAALNGPALGGGACIVTALDIRIAADTAHVAYPEINLGMSLSWYGLPLCIHLVGPALAKRLVILGNNEPADLLLQWGFLDEVLPQDQLMSRAQELAAEYASKPPIAAQMIKRSVNALTTAHDQSIMHMDIDQLLLTSTTQDSAEGVQAQLQKRPPNFTGR